MNRTAAALAALDDYTAQNPGPSFRATDDQRSINAERLRLLESAKARSDRAKQARSAVVKRNPVVNPDLSDNASDKSGTLALIAQAARRIARAGT